MNPFIDVSDRTFNRNFQLCGFSILFLRILFLFSFASFTGLK